MKTAAIRQPRDLFPATWFSVEASSQPGDERLLHPQERALVARAVAKRRADFAAGRGCARRALARLGVPPAPLLHDAHGCPLWPAGTLGSISHTEGCAVSVVGLRGPVGAVGIDIERSDPGAAAAILAHVCSAHERRALLALPEALRTAHACALFSAKEAIYKCVYAATGERLGFGDAAVALDFRLGLFRATLRSPAKRPRRTQVTGRLGCNEQHVFAGLYWLVDHDLHDPSEASR